jgi:branched-subunit amino acid ABC-type transport system permease component
MDAIVLLQILWTGTATASYAALFAMAFALVLKVVRLWNFAQAGMMGIAFFAMYATINRFGWSLPAALLFGFALTAAITLALEVFGFRTLRARQSSALMFFIFTLVCSEFAAYALTLLFGTEPVALYPETLSPVHMMGSIAVTEWDLIAVSAMLVLMAALWSYLRFSRDGQFLVAVADNARLAELYGISARRAYLITFAIATLLVCAGMALFGTRSPVMPTTAIQLMLSAVIATLLGGIGNVFGAALAAIGLALLQSYSVLVIPSAWQNLILYAALFVTILFFPQGVRFPEVFGRSRRPTSAR